MCVPIQVTNGRHTVVVWFHMTGLDFFIMQLLVLCPNLTLFGSQSRERRNCVHLTQLRRLL